MRLQHHCHRDDSTVPNRIFVSARRFHNHFDNTFSCDTATQRFHKFVPDPVVDDTVAVPIVVVVAVVAAAVVVVVFVVVVVDVGELVVRENDIANDDNYSDRVGDVVA